MRNKSTSEERESRRGVSEKEVEGMRFTLRYSEVRERELNRKYAQETRSANRKRDKRRATKRRNATNQEEPKMAESDSRG